MDERETFARADQLLTEVVGRVESDQWDAQLPERFPIAGDGGRTLRDVIGYQTYDEAWIPDMVAGRSMDEVGADAYGDPFGNDLIGEEPQTALRELTDKAISAVQAIDVADLDRVDVHYSYGDFPLREALWHAIVFRMTRAHDVADAIGAEIDVPDDLVSAVWDIVEPHADEWRSLGVFGPEVSVPADAPRRDRLFALTGRQP